MLLFFELTFYRFGIDANFHERMHVVVVVVVVVGYLPWKISIWLQFSYYNIVDMDSLSMPMYYVTVYFVPKVCQPQHTPRPSI